MKWNYTIATNTLGHPDAQRIEGAYFGDFLGATQQVVSAVLHEGWDKNTVGVTIKLTPAEGSER